METIINECRFKKNTIGIFSLFCEKYNANTLDAVSKAKMKIALSLFRKSINLHHQALNRAKENKETITIGLIYHLCDVDNSLDDAQLQNSPVFDELLASLKTAISIIENNIDLNQNLEKKTKETKGEIDVKTLGKLSKLCQRYNLKTLDSVTKEELDISFTHFRKSIMLCQKACNWKIEPQKSLGIGFISQICDVETCLRNGQLQNSPSFSEIQAELVTAVSIVKNNINLENNEDEIKPVVDLSTAK